MQFLKLSTAVAVLTSLSALGAAQAIQPIISPAGSNFVTPTAMNNHGVVVGYYFVSGGKGSNTRPFMWDGTFHTLPSPANGGQANGINDDGVIVGSATDDMGVGHAVRYTLTDYTILDDGSGGYAGPINNLGNFLYQDPLGVSYYRNIDTAQQTQVGSSFTRAFGEQINDANEVAGVASGQTMFADLGSGNEFNLTALIPGYSSYGTLAIGPNSIVSGVALKSGGKGQPSITAWFLWDPINGMQTSSDTRYRCFNNLGDAVGGQIIAGRDTAMYFHAGVGTRVDDLIGPSPILSSEAFLVNNLGQMVISTTGGPGSNIAFFDPSLVVNLDPTVTISGDGTFDFDGNPHPATATVTGYGGAVLSPDATITYDPGGSDAPTQPGTYQVTASYPGTAHYNAATATSTIVINSSTQPVNISLQGGTFTYDGNAHPATFSVTDGNNQPVAVSPNITYSPGGSNPPVTPGTYGVSATFDGNSSYQPASATGTIVIGKADLVVSADSLTKVLNAPVPTLSGSMTGAVPGDGLSASFSTSATASSPIGTYPIVAAVNDPLGRLSYYNVVTTDGTLKVVFAGNSGVLQPVNTDGSSVFKQGSTVPIKLKIYDANGASVSDPGTITSFYIVQIVSGTVTTTVNETVNSTTPDNQFRWDGSEWIFNVSTKSLTANQTYYFQITLADGSTVNFRFGLR